MKRNQIRKKNFNFKSLMIPFQITTSKCIIIIINYVLIVETNKILIETSNSSICKIF
jgi:hypothetical protein